MEYVKRSAGGNACRKSAYNMRGKLQDTKSGKVFSFNSRKGLAFHAILLPKHANEKFKDENVLWNAVEAAETRKNSQVCREVVLALPDDKEVTLDHKIELVKRFANTHFVEKNYIVQIDIHEPHITKDKNWHAHLSITPREVAKDGNSFAKTKNRNIDPIICKGKVISGTNWGAIWRDSQDIFFEEKGLDIRVDEIGIISQEHLGPVRMRKHMSDINLKNEALKEANLAASQNPDDVIKHVSRFHAAFTEKHIDSYLNKYVPGDLKKQVKEDILGHEDIIPLYNRHTGNQVEYYTTKQVRAEEERVIREADRINTSARLQAMPSRIEEVVTERSFSKEQLSVFNYAVSGDQGIKVIEGRAGTGKSYVLHGIREAYERSGARVIGLTKDNGPKNDMMNNGFREAYTAKMFLFLCHNNRMNVRSGSIFLVDESALLDTPAYNELFKVAREHSCKVILVGDDKQQTPVERGGMFTIIAGRYGSMALTEVRRQTVEWQRSVSEYLSDSNFIEAIDLLENNKRIHWNNTREESVSSLVEKWCRDSLEKPDQNKVILAHSNFNVDTINQAIRRVQQALGKVSTKEYVCDTYRGDMAFAKGDRIIFAKTDKARGLFAGDMGTLHKASEISFTVLKDNGEKVSFDPSLYKGLNLAYTVTIYKAQGKTVDRAYVLHSPTMNDKQNYVSLTRQVKDVHFFVTRDDTKNLKHLAIQMGKQDDKISSLEFNTFADIEKLYMEETTRFDKIAYKLEDKVQSILHSFKDRLHNNAEFYAYRGGTDTSKVLVRARDAEQHWQQEAVDESTKNNSTSRTHQVKGSVRSRDSESAPSEKAEVGISGRNFKSNKPKLEASVVEEVLKKDIKGFAIRLLGEPDKKLSTARELVFHKNGKVSVNLETGLWKDFVNDTGGNIFSLIQREYGGNFKEALTYAASYAGIGENAKPIAKKETQVAETAKEPTKGAPDADKVKRALALYEKSVDINGTLAEKYLREHRNIQGELSSDLRFSNKVYNSELKKEIPALLAFARNKENNITACQVIYLNKSTGNKADLNISKKTFGNLSGSFVEIQKGEGVAYIAEGVETALSVQEIGLKGNIVASLGVQNIKHFNRDAQSLVICADNDGQNAPSRSVIEKSIATLEKKGYSTSVIEPQLTGEDFNDVLKKQGREEVAKYFGIESKPSEAIPHDHVYAEQIQKTKPSAKAKEETSSKLDTVKELQILTKQYQKDLTAIYKNKLGGDYKDFKSEIAAIASRSAQDVLIQKTAPIDKDLQLIFAKNQHITRRINVLTEKFVAQDKNCVTSWMSHHFKAEMLATMEGRFFAEIRSQKNKLTKSDETYIATKAKRVLENSEPKLKSYRIEAEKTYGFEPEKAKIFAQQKFMLEERIGQSLDSKKVEVIKLAVDHSYNYFKDQKHEAIKVSSQKNGQDAQAQDNTQQTIRYKSHQVVKEILSYFIISKNPALLPAEDLRRIEKAVERKFEINRAYYQDLQQQKLNQDQQMKAKNSGLEH